MVTRENIIEFIESIKGKPSINPTNVINMLNNIKDNYNCEFRKKISKIKVGDIISAMNSSGIPHPSIVIRVEEDGVLVLPITHNPPSIYHIVCPECRVLNSVEQSYIMLCPLFVKMEIAVNSFLGIFENTKELRNIIRYSNKYLRSLKLLNYKS